MRNKSWFVFCIYTMHTDLKMSRLGSIGSTVYYTSIPCPVLCYDALLRFYVGSIEGKKQPWGCNHLVNSEGEKKRKEWNRIFLSVVSWVFYSPHEVYAYDVFGWAASHLISFTIIPLTRVPMNIMDIQKKSREVHRNITLSPWFRFVQYFKKRANVFYVKYVILNVLDFGLSNKFYPIVAEYNLGTSWFNICDT